MCRYVGDVTHVCGRRRGRREGAVGGAGPGADPPSPAAPHAPRTHRTRATPPLRATRSRRHSARAPQSRHTSALRSAARTAVPTTPDRRCRAEPSVCIVPDSWKLLVSPLLDQTVLWNRKECDARIAVRREDDLRRKGWSEGCERTEGGARPRTRPPRFCSRLLHTRGHRRARWTTSRPPSAARSTTASAGTTTRRTCCAPSKRCCTPKPSSTSR